MKTGKAGILSASLTHKLRQIVDLRNNIIHRYWVINNEQLYNITVENKDNLIAFVNQINTFLASIKRN
ncbi:MAG: hypothetical protein JETT_1491 [Candidatus Jettenia ecosi]|uniref:DUF86 domain-containing protein n=1 Tax=Candidatus Jettenia ecosi TaxID=2494326 RepID=A0A533QC06_9BACT|nr:MAG: hypothetical protein JETT_1491 [Candidatus Jettenia ecosi]